MSFLYASMQDADTSCLKLLNQNVAYKMPRLCILCLMVITRQLLLDNLYEESRVTCCIAGETNQTRPAGLLHMSWGGGGLSSIVVCSHEEAAS